MRGSFGRHARIGRYLTEYGVGQSTEAGETRALKRRDSSVDGGMGWRLEKHELSRAHTERLADSQGAVRNGFPQKIVYCGVYLTEMPE